uniref:Uncharacterized protein n=1 Tax=Sphaerodactylus townsendi TaxID=933632 RepID=A0ACB8ECA6_9SAUR
MAFLHLEEQVNEAARMARHTVSAERLEVRQEFYDPDAWARELTKEEEELLGATALPTTDPDPSPDLKLDCWEAQMDALERTKCDWELEREALERERAAFLEEREQQRQILQAEMDQERCFTNSTCKISPSKTKSWNSPGSTSNANVNV